MGENAIKDYNNYIVDKNDGCSIVISGRMIRYVTKYSVKCSKSCVIELRLHMSVPRKGSVSYRIEDIGGKYALFADGRPIDYLVSDYTIERNESRMMELDVHLSIPQSEMYLDIENRYQDI